MTEETYKHVRTLSVCLRSNNKSCIDDLAKAFNKSINRVANNNPTQEVFVVAIDTDGELYGKEVKPSGIQL